MRDGIFSALVIVLMFIGLPVVILVMKDRLTRARRNRPIQRSRDAEQRQAYERRILAPDWLCVERHLRRPVPQTLRELYADPSLVTLRDLRCSMEYTLSTFEALDERAMADAKAWIGFEAVVFASTQEGDAIYLRPGASEENAVFLTHHDGHDTEVFAASLHEMVEMLRRS